MNSRLTLVGLALLMTIVPAGAEDTTLKDYTDTLLKTYGPDATVTNGTVEGKTNSGEEFSDTYPQMSFDTATVASCGIAWSGAACPGGGTSAHKFCANHQIIGGVEYEVQHDFYYYFNGSLRRISTLLDCQATCTQGELGTTVYNQFCPH